MTAATGTHTRALAAARVVLAAGVVAIVVTVVALSVWRPADFAWGLAWAGFLVVGTLILWRQLGNTIGWLMAATGAIQCLLLFASSAMSTPPGRGPAALEALARTVSPVPWLLVVAIVVLFPDPRPAGRLERLLLRTLVVVGVLVSLAFALGLPTLDSGRTNPWAVPVLEPVGRFAFGGGFSVVPMLMVVAVLSLVRRWRASTGTRRAQFKYLFWGALLALIALAVGTPFTSSWVFVVVILGFNALPASIGAAVTRFRLYDIDRLVSRTASYLVVTGLVLATYALVVTATLRLLPVSSSLAVGTATLVAAALFQPLLKRVQSRVDRRFNRTRYDAERTVEHFGEQLRHEVEIAAVVTDLERAVRRSLEPTEVVLWLPAR